jgi:DNA-binding NtrC family response regulator
MFGHRKGAFTDAVRDKPGLLETANGGTMFLDELTEMSKPIQAKLLRVIQDGVVRRVGSESVDAVVNVRFIAATNTNPEDAVESGVLREDLYYRLRVVPLRVPPLRERKTDIPILAEHFLRHYWARHRDRPSSAPRFSEEAFNALKGYGWKGNVRELQNLMEHAVVLLQAGSEVQPGDLPFIKDAEEVADYDSAVASLTTSLGDETYHDARERVLREFELLYLKNLISAAQGNMSKAARQAGVDRTTLYRLMEKHGLQRETIMVASE